MATALVLGGSGQVGRAVVPALIGDGWDVRVLCRGTGDHIAHVRAWSARTVPDDRHDDGALDEALGRGVDVLVDAIGYDDREAAALLARRDRIGSAIVISSAAVYADAAGRSFETDEFPVLPIPVPESHRTVAPGRDSYVAGTVLAYGGDSRLHTTSTVARAELVRLAPAAPGSRVLNAADPVALTVGEIGAAVHAVMGYDARTAEDAYLARAEQATRGGRG